MKRLGLLITLLLLFPIPVTAQTGLYVDTDGDVGIGTDTPTHPLEVEGDAHIQDGTVTVDNSTWGSTALQHNGIRVIDAPTTYIESEGDASLIFRVDEVNAIAVHPDAIVSGGRIDFQDPAYAEQTLRVDGAVRFANYSDYCGLATDVSGNIEEADCGASSAILKTQVLAYTSGLTALMRLSPVSFKWKDTARRGEQREVGLIAEEMAQVEPLLVGKDKSGKPYRIKYDKVAVLLINAIKQQQAQIEALTKKIAELENRSQQ